MLINKKRPTGRFLFGLRMKIKLLCSRVGPDVVQNRGDEVEVDDAEGLRMIEAGQAAPAAVDVEEAKNKTEAETATKKSPLKKL